MFDQLRRPAPLTSRADAPSVSAKVRRPQPALQAKETAGDEIAGSTIGAAGGAPEVQKKDAGGDAGGAAPRGTSGGGVAKPSKAPAGVVQRYAFVPGGPAQVLKTEPSLTPQMKAMVMDTVVRDYIGLSEFKDHSEKKTDYLGNLADGTWLRFYLGGINLLGENHTLVTLEDVLPAVNSKSFIYEPFSSDPLAAGSKMKSAYDKETTGRFQRFGVSGVQNKQQFGEESLYPKIGYNMILSLPYFTKAKPVSDLKPAGYVGQPMQRYLKIAWGLSQDNKTDVAAKKKAGTAVSAKLDALATTHAAVEATLDPFITALPVDGFLGDELEKPANAKVFDPLAQFATAMLDAMLEMAAGDPSARFSAAEKAKLTAAGTSASDKEDLLEKWRNFKFEDSVKTATAAGVRYAGMGQAHLENLINIGLSSTQHPFKMADEDLQRFKDETAKLAAKAVKQ
jgi:hypothetical protein